MQVYGWIILFSNFIHFLPSYIFFLTCNTSPTWKGSVHARSFQLKCGRSSTFGTIAQLLYIPLMMSLTWREYTAHRVAWKTSGLERYTWPFCFLSFSSWRNLRKPYKNLKKKKIVTENIMKHGDLHFFPFLSRAMNAFLKSRTPFNSL